MKQPDLSIVIPAYREEKRLGRTLDELASYLHTDQAIKRRHVEVLVVAADTDDKTWQIARAKGRRFTAFALLKPGAPAGKGRDVQYGMLRARGRYVLFMDADLATPLHHIAEFFAACQNGADVVIGTRNLRTYRRNRLRNWFSWLGNRAYRAASGQAVEDTQCGFKIFTAQARDICFSRQTIIGWSFDLEILTIAKIHHLRLKSIRLDDWHDQPLSTYHENPLKITGRMTHDFSKIFLNTKRGFYS